MLAGYSDVEAYEQSGTDIIDQDADGTPVGALTHG